MAAATAAVMQQQQQPKRKYFGKPPERPTFNAWLARHADRHCLPETFLNRVMASDPNWPQTSSRTLLRAYIERTHPKYVRTFDVAWGTYDAVWLTKDQEPPGRQQAAPDDGD